MHTIQFLRRVINALPINALPISAFALLGSSIILAVSLSANAQPYAPAPGPSDVRTDRSADEAINRYCEYVRNAAGSESAVQMAPSVYANAGVVNADTSGNDPLQQTSPTKRITVGVLYDFVNLYRGLITRTRAEAQCLRYEALIRLRQFLEINGEGSSVGALLAQAKVLEAAVPQADQIVERARLGVERGELVISELSAIQLRANDLKSQLARVHQQIEALPRQQGKAPGVAQLRQLRQDSEILLEQQEGRLRRAGAWGLSIRGGYDYFFEREEQQPWFALLSLSFNLGAFWQYGADQRARQARRAWVAQRAGTIDRQFQLLLQKLQVARTIERQRLLETNVLSADLTHRLKTLERLQDPKIRQFRDYLWFDWVKVRAEHVFLEAHVRDLDGLLSESPSDGQPTATTHRAQTLIRSAGHGQSANDLR